MQNYTINNIFRILFQLIRIDYQQVKLEKKKRKHQWSQLNNSKQTFLIFYLASNTDIVHDFLFYHLQCYK